MIFDNPEGHDSCGVGQVVDLEVSIKRAIADEGEAQNIVADLQRHEILQEGIDELICNHHRIGVLPDGTGDGCGIATDIPINFYNKVIKDSFGGTRNYAFGELAVGQLFLPRDTSKTVNGKTPQAIIEALIKNDERFKTKFEFIGFREVPIDKKGLSERAIDAMPNIQQVFFRVKEGVSKEEAEEVCIEMQGALDQKFLEFNNAQDEEKNRVNVVSLSTDTIAWKGMLRPDQLQGFYSDLGEKEYKSSRVLYHGRMSTNSDPQWAYAHPNNKIGHNGEFNTVEGNRADRRAVGAEIYKDDAMIAAERGSDSRTFAADIAEHNKRGMPYSEAVAKLLRPAYLNDPTLSDQAKAMLHVFDLERKAYTGPAHIVACTDEEQFAALDGNGLRPSRYALTIKKIPEGEEGTKITAEMENRKHQDHSWPYNLVPEGWMLAKLHIGSEDLWQDDALKEKGEFVLVRGILSAGEMLLHKADGRFYQGRELIEEMAAREDWQDQLAIICQKGAKPDFSSSKPEKHDLDLTSRMHLLLWDEETPKVILDPMIESGKVPVSAMGDDGEVLKIDHPVHMAAYFKQIFAQITNPPLDYIREKESFSLQTNIGKNPALGGKLLTFDKPFLMDNQMQEVRDKLSTVTIDLTYEAGTTPEEAMANYDTALRRIVDEAIDAAGKGKIIILSDKEIALDKSAVSDIDAVATIDKALKKHGQETRVPMRSNTDIVVESGQAKDPHHAAVLFAFGAKAVNCYLVNEYVRDQFNRNRKMFEGKGIEEVFTNAYKGFEYAYGKTLGRYGIANHENYVGGGLMEAHGLDTSKGGFGDSFEGTYSPAAGINRADIALAHAANNALANEGLKDFEALENVIRSIVKEATGKRTALSPNIRAILQVHYSALKRSIYAENNDARNKILTRHLTAVIRSILPAGSLGDAKISEVTIPEAKIPEITIREDIVSGVAIPELTIPELTIPKFRIPEDAEIKSRIKEAILSRADEIADLLERTRPSQEQLQHYGQFSMRKEGIAHRMGPELVKQTNAMFQKIANKRQTDIDHRIHILNFAEHGKYGELEDTEDLDYYLRFASIPVAERKEAIEKEKERLEKHLHAPFDEEGRISKDYIAEIKEPSAEYKTFAKATDDSRQKHKIALRDYVNIDDSGREALSDDEMEFNTLDVIQRMTRTGQMSQGALTPSAWQAIARAENMVHGNPASGEGGEDLSLLGTVHSPKNKQIASGRFGISPEMLASTAREDGEIQIKIMQGAKPGEGGEMPGGKVTVQISTLRQSIPGEPLASPAPMHDIYSIEDLTQLIHDLKSIPKTDKEGQIIYEDGQPKTLKVDVKIGATSSVEVVARGAAKAGADSITLAGHEGGTGAAPAISARNTGQDWLFDLARIDKGLREDGTRSKLKLVAEGGIITHHDALLALKYADMVGQGTFEMILNRCIMARRCNVAGLSDGQIDTYRAKFAQEYGRPPTEPQDFYELVDDGYCPTGVANSEELFKEEPWRIEQYRMDFAAAIYEHLREHGYKNLKEWQQDRRFTYEQPDIQGKLDFKILNQPVVPEAQFVQHPMGNAPADRADDKWLPEVKQYLKDVLGANPPMTKAGAFDLNVRAPLVLPIYHANPSDRSLGARTAGLLAMQLHDGRNYMEKYPRQQAIGAEVHVKVQGNTGQMLGFVNSHGEFLKLMGVAQDGVGKSGSAGRIAISPDIPDDHPCKDTYRDNCVLAGNVVGYGNYGTSIYIAGKIGTRANVCAHGGILVCEGMGDYAAEFQTQGTVLNLGELGAHACNAMIGGLFIQYDPDKNYEKARGDTRLATPEETEIGLPMVKRLLEQHRDATGSKKADEILKNWDHEKGNFKLMVPKAMDHIQTQAQLDNFKEQIEQQKAPLDPGTSLVEAFAHERIMGSPKAARD